MRSTLEKITYSHPLIVSAMDIGTRLAVLILRTTISESVSGIWAPVNPFFQIFENFKTSYVYVSKIMALNIWKGIYRRSIHKKVPFKNTLYFGKYKKTNDEVDPRQCPCRRAFDLESELGTWRTRRRSDESRGTRGFTQVQPPRKVKGLRPACLTLYLGGDGDDGVTMVA
jgi:hypothetical protein